MLLLWCLLCLPLLLHTEADRHNLQGKLQNKLILMHQQYAQRLNKSDCWICTHTPLSAKIMPYLAIPVPLEELVNTTHASYGTFSTEKFNYSIHGLQLTTWMYAPWWTIERENPVQINKGQSYICLNSKNCKNNTTDSSHHLGYTPKGTILNLHCNWEKGLTYKLTEKGKQYEHLFANKTLREPLFTYAFQGSILGQIKLPYNWFWACGNTAYKLLPIGGRGRCTIIKIAPATWFVEKDMISIEQISNHHMYKRSADKTKKERLLQVPWYAKVGVFTGLIGTGGLTLINSQNIELLAGLFDNVTDEIFQTIGIVNEELKWHTKLLAQHTLVLDFLTAAQGGTCAIVGAACCNFIHQNYSEIIDGHLKHMEEVKNAFRKKNSEIISLEFLNPVNWFSGWIGNMLNTILCIFIVGIAIYIGIRLFFCCINKMTTVSKATE